LLRDRNLRSAVFVSDPTHMLRVLRIADGLGIEAYGSPTTTSPLQHDPMRQVQAAVHELGALAVYFLTGTTPQVESPGGERRLAPVDVPRKRCAARTENRAGETGPPSWNARAPAVHSASAFRPEGP